jgi:hypothetical protein
MDKEIREITWQNRIMGVFLILIFGFVVLTVIMRLLGYE